ncbi:helix-turn-helix domain-containing protein [Nocardia takedensis]|uniref:helix-turn-helix domain-containing protein n=1 Tax=Nocardia takedensis TaxID=259390 RepID=UPI003F75F477
MSWGQQLQQWRIAQGWSQSELAERLTHAAAHHGITACCDDRLIRRWETGPTHPQRTYRGLLGAIGAPAPPSTAPPPKKPETTVMVDDSGLLHLRRVLIGCVPDTPPLLQPELAAAVELAWDLFFSARFHDMHRLLPTILAGAYNAAETATGEPRHHVDQSLAQLLHATSNLLGYIGEEDLAAVALLRADAHAAESGDELTHSAIQGSRSWLLAKNGLYDDAAAYAEHAATAIEPRLSTATPRHIAIWGELLCYAAFAASRAGEHGEARRYLRLADAAGTQVDDQYATRPEASNVFGPTSAASFGVINETSADRPREALKLAALVNGGGTGVPPTLLSRRLINVAQAQIHNRDNDAAVTTLHHACSMAPEFVGHIPLAHTLTRDLLTRRRGQRPHGLTDIARHLGVSTRPVGTQP